MTDQPVSKLNPRVEEIIWKIKTLDADELDELHARLGNEFALPDQPHEISTREPVRKAPPARTP